jgi:UDP-N-acetylmuramoyl-tripeptide--D-alanyl-D-alanine ligase
MRFQLRRPPSARIGGTRVMPAGAGRFWARLLQAWRERRLGRALGWRWLKLETAAWRRLQLAPRYRNRVLRRVAFIGVTGSCGKTTTKELIAAVLATRLSGRSTPGNHKVSPHLERTILGVRPWDDFCLVEMAIARRRVLLFDDTLRLIRPQIGVVTVIGTDHLGIYRSVEGVAAQKRRLVECLPAHGTAVLNADDPLVRGMQQHTKARVLTYGVSADAMLRAENVGARWPERLSFTLHHGGRTLEVRTQLCGAHLVASVLAALAVGVAMGIPLEEAVQAVGNVPPFDRRLSPLAHPRGFTIVRDDFKAPLWSIPAALQFMQEARAERKIIVLGTISDYAGKSDATYVAVARQALAVADRVIFVGNASAKCLKAARHGADEALQAFYSVEAAAEHLRDSLRSGDLVLLKGSPIDGLEAIVTESKRPPRMAAARAAGLREAESRGRFEVVVGLGNPGASRYDTPHNVGHRVLDRLASVLGAEWKREKDGMVARVEDGASRVVLLKPSARMNATGPRLRAIGERLGFGPPELILVHDDLDLPIRSVRVRARSGDGGHRGVRSVLQAFRTDEIRRVRVGVGRPEEGQEVEDYVVTPFDAASLGRIEEACAEAADHVLALLGRHERLRGRAARARAEPDR